MGNAVTTEVFRSELIGLLSETFERVEGYYLDSGTSLFETLETITSEEASRPVSATCASIAGQVEHTSIYIWLITEILRGKDESISDWQTTWTTTSVTEEEWVRLKERLRREYTALRTVLDDPATLEREDAVGDALAVLTHTAYHLGEIRQALCTVKQN